VKEIDSKVFTSAVPYDDPEGRRQYSLDRREMNCVFSLQPGFVANSGFNQRSLLGVPHGLTVPRQSVLGTQLWCMEFPDDYLGKVEDTIIIWTSSGTSLLQS